MCVSGGGLSSPCRFERVRNDRFFCPEGKLAGAFRECFLAGLKRLREQQKLSFSGDAEAFRNHYHWQDMLTCLYHKQWNVFIKETFNGNGNAITYLSRYAYRTAIGNSRILDVSGKGVTIRWKDYKDGGKVKPLFLTGEEFIRRFLMHVLPKGFCRIRYGGVLSNSRKKDCLKQIRRITGTSERKNRLAGLSAAERIKAVFHVDICKCPVCSGHMNLYRLWPDVMLC